MVRKAFLKCIMYYMIYQVLFTLLHLSSYSLALFFHSLLNHSLSEAAQVVELNRMALTKFIASIVFLMFYLYRHKSYMKLFFKQRFSFLPGRLTLMTFIFFLFVAVLQGTWGLVGDFWQPFITKALFYFSEALVLLSLFSFEKINLSSLDNKSSWLLYLFSILSFVLWNKLNGMRESLWPMVHFTFLFTFLTAEKNKLASSFWYCCFLSSFTLFWTFKKEQLISIEMILFGLVVLFFLKMRQSLPKKVFYFNS